MENINIDEIGYLLGPSSPPGLIWNILLYIIFFLALVSMLLQGDKALLPTMILAGALLLVVLAKLQVFPPREFGAFVVNAGIFILPGLVAGMTRSPKGRPPAILAAVFGAVFFFAYWFFFQRI